MTKDAELAVIQTAIDALGNDSYIGPWLREQLPFMEMDLRSDLFPCVTWEGSKEELDAIRANAERQTADIVAAAQAKADKSEKERQYWMDHAIKEVRKALYSLEHS